jgi:hypothetical protein
MKTGSAEKEADRLSALHSYNILDTLPEDTFDHVSYLAALTCAMPIALVSFVDANRQWSKSLFGTRLAETPREIAFCNHAIDGTDVLVVPDTRADERFVNNPLVVSRPFIRFYAGAPIITASGDALGTVCVMDYKPRTLEEHQRRALKALAELALMQLELRHRSAHVFDMFVRVQRLNGLLPICNACKKIRNDPGYWRQVEAYISEHSEDDFTHCICPECFEKLYGQHRDERAKERPG